ncbi:MATE family efflux transporter [Lachnospiraceae bacterium 62-35]
MKIQLSDHFTYKRLLRFVLPSIIMMIFTSIYGVVDGLFVSNYVGKTSFAAVNLIMPLLMIMGALGFMMGTGGSAIVAKTLGEGKKEKANQYFSMMIYATVVGGVLLTVAGLVWLRPVTLALGAEGDMAEDCILYGKFLLTAQTAFMLQNVFQSFLITAEKPQLGLVVTIAAGLTNIILDFLLVGVFPFGIAGAAIATVMSQVVGGILPLIYFMRKNDSLLRFIPVRIDWRILFKACINGSSELMTNISMSVVTILYNFQLMHIAGEDGVAAYGVIMYVSFIFAAIFIGYSIGSAPIISYNYGSGNQKELKNLFCKSNILIGVTGICLALLSEVLSEPLTRVFVGYDKGLMEMTLHGFRLYAISFVLVGFNIFGSSFFTALNNGGVSAAISFLRTLVFQTISVIILPIFLKEDGIWLAIVAAEILAAIVTGGFFVRGKKRYHYM